MYIISVSCPPVLEGEEEWSSSASLNRSSFSSRNLSYFVPCTQSATERGKQRISEEPHSFIISPKSVTWTKPGTWTEVDTSSQIQILYHDICVQRIMLRLCSLFSVWAFWNLIFPLSKRGTPTAFNWFSEEKERWKSKGNSNISYYFLHIGSIPSSESLVKHRLDM